MSFDVPIGPVTTAGIKMSSAIDQAKDLDAGSALATVTNALPDADSATAATAWGTQWTSDVADWRSDAKSYADLLKSCVDSYVAADEDAALNAQRLLEQLAEGS